VRPSSRVWESKPSQENVDKIEGFVRDRTESQGGKPLFPNSGKSVEAPQRRDVLPKGGRSVSR
jgi:hypothetical protein